MGVNYEASCKRVANAEANTYRSVLAPVGETANSNLQGYHRFTTTRMDGIAILENLQFQADTTGPRTSCITRTLTGKKLRRN